MKKIVGNTDTAFHLTFISITKDHYTVNMSTKIPVALN